MNNDPLGFGGFRPIAQQVTTTKKKKNFFEDNISTVGSMGGSLAGAAGGAAIGSIVPGVGTAIGGLLGAILGGAGGGAAGQVAENAVMGDNLGTDVGSEALWGGLTSLPFGATGKLLKAGSKVVTGLGSDVARTAAKDLVQEAGVKTIGRGTLGKMVKNGTADNAALSAIERVGITPNFAGKAASKLNGAADDLAVKQFRLTPTQVTNFKNIHGEDPGALLRRTGISSVEDITAKGIDPLQNSFDNVISSIPDISAKELDSGLKSVYDPLLKSPALFQQQLGQQIKAQADELVKFAGNGSIPASKVNDLRKTFDSAVKYTQRGAPDFNTAKETADALRGLLQKTADNAGIKSADGKTFKEIGKELSKMYGLDEIATKQGNVGRGSLPVTIPGLIGAAVGGGAGGIPGAIAGAMLTNALNSNTGRKVMMNLADKAVTGLGSKAANKIAGQTIPQLIGRNTPVGLYKSIMNGGQSSDLNTTPEMNTASMTTTAASIPSNMPTSSSNSQQMSSPFGYSSGQLGQALMKAYAAGDSKAASQLEKMYSVVSEYEAAQVKAASTSTAAGYSKPSASQYSQGATAMQSLDSLDQLLQQNPNIVNANAMPGQGVPVLGGLISGAAGTGQYRALTKNILNSVARINTGANMPESEVQFYEQTYLPQPGDSKVSRAQKLQNLRQFFSPIVNYSGGGTDILGAIQQMQ